MELEAAAPEAAWPSIDDVIPSEQGGPNARKGFTYQDEIAVGFLIEMLSDPTLVKIHFETHDDLILVRAPAEGGKATAEFVQVKAGEPDKLWSVADLCQRPKKEVGTSIFEISLQRDRHEETALFRIITLRPVVAALAPLSYAFDSEARAPACEAMMALRAELEERCPDAKSDKDHGCDYWLANCRWDARHDKGTVEDINLMRLVAYTQKTGHPLLLEQIQVVLGEMRAWAKAAGDALWIPDRAKKIVSRVELIAWWRERMNKLIEDASRQSGGKLAEKMKAASLSEPLVAMAIELRLGYAASVRTSRYMETDQAEHLQGRVKSEVQSLSAKLAAGQLDMNGPQFHALCVESMDAINAARPSGEQDQSAFLKGCLYDIADRCLLRFDRTTP